MQCYGKELYFKMVWLYINYVTIFTVKCTPTYICTYAQKEDEDMEVFPLHHAKCIPETDENNTDLHVTLT